MEFRVLFDRARWQQRALGAEVADQFEAVEVFRARKGCLFNFCATSSAKLADF